MWQFLENIKDTIQGIIEFIVEYPGRTLLFIGIFAVFVLGTWDIWEGRWVSHSGRVTGRYWEYETVCDSQDDKGRCTSSHTETNYYLTVSHQGFVDDVGVTVWDYMKYSNGEAVQINYREGGVFRIHWFLSVSDPKPDF